MLRRLKSEVLKDLPERIFSPKYLELSDAEKKKYLTIAKVGQDTLKKYFTILKEFERITGRKVITKDEGEQNTAL